MKSLYVAFLIFLCLLATPAYSAKKNEKEEDFSGGQHRVLSPQEKQFYQEYYLPYHFRVKGTTALLTPTQHDVQFNQVPEGFLKPILDRQELILENTAKDPKGLGWKRIVKGITDLVEKCGGREKIFLPPGTPNFHIPQTHEHFQHAWHCILEALPPEDQEKLSFLKDIGCLRPGFVATLNFMCDSGSTADIDTGFDMALLKDFKEKGKPVSGLEDPISTLVPNCSIQTVEEVRGNFDNDQLKVLQNFPAYVKWKTILDQMNEATEHLEKQVGVLPQERILESMIEYAKAFEVRYTDPTLPSSLKSSFLRAWERCTKIGVPAESALPSTEPPSQVKLPDLFERLKTLEGHDNDAHDILTVNDAMGVRNRAWIPTILSKLNTDSAIGVGVMHFVGPKGLLCLLQNEGKTLEYRGSDGEWREFRYEPLKGGDIASAASASASASAS